jgi:pyridoxine 5-phosphate synthase
MTKLSVNLNKIALLRNARGEGQPDLARAARTCIEQGCAGITVHPRPDQRHIRPDDVRMLSALTREHGVEFNVEGNPFNDARGDYPGFMALVAEVRPTQVTLVPDGDAQLTSDHGFVPDDAARLAPLLARLHEQGSRVSLFVDASETRLRDFAQAGADRVEIYTGPYAHAFASGDPPEALARCVATAQAAHDCGLQVNAGHDLDQNNLGALVAAIPALAEVSIGHALIVDALYSGLAPTIRAYLATLGPA